MKNLTSKSLRFIPVILGLMFCLLANSAGAVVLYWDNNGTAAATSGTWDTTSSFWATSSILVASPGKWVTSDAACFTAGSGNTGTINISVNSAITMAGIFNGSLNPSGCALTLSGTGSLNISSGVQAALSTGGSDGQPTVVNVPFTGTGQLWPEGSKNCTLNGHSTYSGGTVLDQSGNLFFSVNDAFGTGTIYPFISGSPGYAAVLATVPVTLNNAFVISTINCGINFAANPSCPVVCNGNWDLMNTGYLRNAGGTASPLTLNGIISDIGALNLSANNSSTIILNGANTHSGGTTISSAGATGVTVKLGNSSALGYGPATVALGSILDLNGTSGVNSALTLNGAGISSSGALINSSATPVTLNSGSGIGAIAVTAAGSGIPSTATITISGSGSGATATPVFGVTAASFTITPGTQKYTVAPAVTIGGAKGATVGGLVNSGGATATVTLAGAAPSVIASTVTVTAPGIGFVSAPTITFSGGTTSGAGTAPTGTGNANNFQLVGVGITAPGSGYNSAPTVTINGGSGATANALLTGITLASASSVGGAGNLTINGVISGAAANSLTKVGAGTVTLTGPNTYSGATTVSQGELIGVVGGSIANSALTLNSGTELGVSITDDTKQFSTGALTLSAGTTALDFNFGPFNVPSATIAPLNVNGAATFNSTPTVSIESGSLPAGTGIYPLMTWTSETGTAPTTAILPPHVTGSLGVVGTTLNLNITANTQPLTWNNSGTGAWDIGGTQNWTDSSGNPSFYLQTPSPGDAVIFGDTYITASPVVTLAANVTPASVTANNSTYSYTISGAGAIAGSTGLLKQGTGTMTLLNANTYTGGTTISAGTLQLGDGATANGSVAGNISVTSPGNLVFANPNPQTYAGAITGTGLVTVQGPALLTLGDGVANNGTVAGSILDNASLAFANPFAETYSGVISGAGSLTELGPGTLTLNNASLVGGGTTITAGALRLGDGATANGSVGNITDNAKLIFANPSAQNYSGLISGSGSLAASGPGALTLSGLSTYTGVTTLSGGTVQVDSTETAGTSGPLGKSAAANPGSIAFSGGTLQFSGANANDYSGRFSTAASQAYKVDVNGQPVTFGTALTSSGGALTLSDTAGGGSLTLTAANSYSGATTINTGAKLTIGSPGDLGSGSYAGAIANGGTFTYASSAAQTLSGGITGSGTLIVNNSAAVLTLTAALANTTVDIISGNLTANMANPNVFAPGTIITFGGVGTSGTLDLFGRTTVNISQIAVAAGATASSQIIQNGATGNNATLQINGTCSFGGNIVAGPGTGTTALTVSGAGVTLTLSGNNTYAGATTISSGSVLTISGSGTLPSAPALTDTGTFNYNSSASQTIAGVVSGAGALNVNNAAGTLTLSGVNTYTGNITITAGTLTISGGGKLGNGTYAGTIADNGTFNFNGTVSQTLSGNITGSGALGFNPAGANGQIVTLSGNNAGFTGPTTIANLGQVVITADSQLGTPPAFSATELALNGGFLRVKATTALSSNRGITLGAPASIFGQSLGASIQVDAGDTLTITAPIADSVNGGVMLFGLGENIPVQGMGTNILTAANTYIGQTVIANGRVMLGSGGSLPIGTTLIMVPDNSGGSYFDLGGNAQTIGPLSTTNHIYTGTADGTGTPTILLSGASALTILQTNTTTTFNGVITGSGSLTLNGNSLGTNILAKANSYTGGTTITGGTLDGSVTGSIPGNVTNTGAGILELDTATTMSSSAILALDSSPAPSSVNLNYTGTQTISALSFGATLQAQGVWGAPGNPGATYTSSAFTGTGLLNVCPVPGQTITAAPAVCANSLGNTASVTTTAGATYAWAITGGTITAGGSSSTVTYTAGASGAVTLNCVVTAACGTPSAGGQNISVTINPLPTVSVNSATVCAGTPAMLTATTSASSPTYLWNDPGSSTTPSITVSPASTTTYTVTVTDGTTGCANSGSGTVTVNPLPTVSVNSQAICAGGPATLTATTSASSPSYLWSPGGATTPSITVSPASTTTYTVTVTDGVTGCANSGSGTVTVNPVPIASAGTGQNLSCLGCGVTIGGSPTASGGSGVYSYSWSPATGLSSATAANPTASPLSTTTYTVTVTDADGCISAPSSMTVTVATVATSISSQPASTAVCSGSTASFSVTALGSSLSYYWTENNNIGWGNAWTMSGSGSTWLGTSTDNDNFQPDCNSFSAAGDINSPISGNALGMYGGTAGDEVAVRTFPALAVGQTVSIDFDNGNVDNGSKVGFSLQTSGGADVLQFYFVGGQANYKYWDTALEEQDSGIGWGYTGTRVQFALTCGNAYVLIVTPCGGVPTTFTGTYSGTIAQVKLFNGNTAGGDEDNIYFNNFIIGGYTDNADNYSGGDYAGQDKGNQPIASANASTYTTPALSANAQYQAVVAGCGGVVLSSVASVTVNPLPTVSVNSATICAGGSAILTATTSASSPTYLWNDPANSTTASITVSPASTTTYTVTVTDGTTGCANSGSGTVTVNPLPTVSVNSEPICAGGSAVLTATTSASTPSYLWNDPASSTTASITVSPASTTTYTVTVTDGVTGCANAGSGTVTVNPLPAVSVNSAAICPGGSAVLTATTSASSPSYLWNDPASSTTASITVSPASTTTYTVTVTDGTTTCANSGSGTVTVYPLPTVSVNSTAICPGGSATLTATTSASSPSYLWSPGGATTASITVSPASTTTYTVTVTDGVTSCANLGSGTVTVNPLPTVSVNSTAVCPGGSATLTATTGASSPSYLWSPGGATTASITVSPASTTTYTVTVTDGTTHCSNSGSGTVTVNAAPTADAGSAQTVCAGTPGGTTIGGSPTATGGTAPYTYSWTPTTGLDDATAANPTAEIGSTTTYTVTVTDANGCTASASVVLTVPPLPNIESITMSGTVVTLVWDSLAGQTYRVQYASDLTPTITWTDLTPDVTATGATATYIYDAAAATPRFYRIFIVCPSRIED